MRRWRHQMFYRVATQVDAAPSWRWKSSVLSELSTLFQFLRLMRALPYDQLRVFSSSSRQGLEEQLEQENRGLASFSMTAAQFLRERLIQPPEEVQRIAERERGPSLERVSITGISQQPVNERSRGGCARESRSISVLERRREELERGPGAEYCARPGTEYFLQRMGKAAYHQRSILL
jgi:hypothetical protein